MDKLGGEKLGDLLVKAGLIDNLQLQTALGHQRRWGGKIGKCLIDLGFLEEAELLKFLSDRFKIKAVDLSKSAITEQTFAVVQEAVAKKYGVVPVFLKEGPGSKKTVILAMSDPSDLKVVDEIQFLTGYRVEPVLATESAISKMLENYGKSYRPEPEDERKIDTVRPFDLRKAHHKPEENPADLESIEVGNEDLLLGGEDVEEILDLKEVQQEGIEITPDDQIKVVKDEVVMVRADKPRPKGSKVGSSTERIPFRPNVRDEFKTPLRPEPGQPNRRIEPPPRPAPVPEAPPDLSLAPPEINLGTPEPPQVLKPEPPPPLPPEPIEIPEPGPEEKMELAQAHEFVEWDAKETPRLETMEESSSAASEPDLEQIPQTQAPKEIKLSQPESADDFWQETEAPTAKPKAPAPAAHDADRLSFEMPLEPPTPPPAPPAPEPEPAARPAPAPKPEFLGSIEELALGQDKESEMYASATPARELAAKELVVPSAEPGEEVGEVSLEFALKTIKELKEDIREKEFQFDELLNLMMKKEIGEITTDIYMRELATLKRQIDQFNKKKE